MKDNNWKLSFKKDVANKWEIMNEGYQNYENTNNVGFLQQASGKMFTIVENYLQIKHSLRVANYRELKALVRHNKNDYDLLLESAQLHYFYYNGVVQMPIDEAEFQYKKVHKKMSKRLKYG